MSDDDADELGPIDYILVEWPDGQPTGEAVPHLIDLVDKGIVRILDFRMLVKDEEGNVAGIAFDDLGEGAEDLRVFEGAASGLVDDDDLTEAATALEPGTAAALLVYENTWAGPFAAAVRRSGGQLVASGRIPVQAVLAALDALED